MTPRVSCWGGESEFCLQILMPLRAHHCKICDACQYRFDHHDLLVGTCIGAFNQKYFLLFALFASLLSCCNAAFAIPGSFCFFFQLPLFILSRKTVMSQHICLGGVRFPKICQSIFHPEKKARPLYTPVITCWDGRVCQARLSGSSSIQWKVNPEKTDFRKSGRDVIFMAGPTGFEPAPSGLTGQRYNQA